MFIFEACNKLLSLGSVYVWKGVEKSSPSVISLHCLAKKLSHSAVCVPLS